MSNTGRNDPCTCGSGKKYKKCCGRSSRSSSVEETSFERPPLNVPLNQRVARAVHFDPTMLLMELRRTFQTASEFDSLYGDDVEEISKLYSESLAYIRFACEDSTSDEKSLRSVQSRLLLNAAKSFSAAVHLLRTGYVLQPGVLVRSALETIGVAVYLCVRPGELKRYEDGTLESTRCIGEAKGVLPWFGELYGSLSEQFVHIGRLHALPNYSFAYTKRHPAVGTNLLILRRLAWMLSVATEFIFTEHFTELRYFRRLESGKYVYLPSKTEPEWLAAFLAPEHLRSE
jgi:hypothetical protein